LPRASSSWPPCINCRFAASPSATSVPVGAPVPTGYISLNWRLVQIPVFVRDYLILHELVHLKQMNHSRRFWVSWLAFALASATLSAGSRTTRIFLNLPPRAPFRLRIAGELRTMSVRENIARLPDAPDPGDAGDDRDGVHLCAAPLQRPQADSPTADQWAGDARHRGRGGRAADPLCLVFALPMAC